MNIGLYQSAASLSALERWQDAVSQNITSSQVSGYRKRTVEFSSQALGEWGNGSGNGDSSTPAIFPKATNSVNYMVGDTQPTGRDLDVAIQSNGFFEIQMPDGTKAYTRNGQFSLKPDRTLVSGSGGEVLSDSGSPIVLAPSGGKITINANGSITQGEIPIGRLSVVRFTNQAGLTPVAGGMFTDNGSAGMTPMEKPDVLQGYMEASNVTPMREMVDLVLISRSYEANQKIIKTADEDAQKELDALG